MSVFGDLKKAGIDSNGRDVRFFRGNVFARNIPAPLGSVWYVNGDVSSSKSGKSWDKAFKTLAEAIAKASDDDIILIAPGVYLETATISITQEGLKIYGFGTSGLIWGPTSLKSNTCADHLITINANGVEIAGLDFICNTAQKDAIRLATTKSVYKIHIHDCHFGGGTGAYGVYTGNTYDAVDVHIERCEFYNYVTAGIRVNGTRDKFTDNFFIIPASGIGIEYIQNTADRPDNLIAGNKFLGSNSGDIGIKITNAPNEDTLMIKDNFFENLATPITVAKYTSWYADNHFGIADELYLPKAKTWYVNRSVAASGDGKSRSSAFKTVAEAFTATNALIDWGASPWASGDTIVVANGSYAEALTSVPYGCTVIGEGEAFDADGENGVRIKPASGAAFDVASCVNVKFVNINFEVANASRVFDAAILNNTQFIHCRFAGPPEATTATCGIYTNDSVMLTVRDCRFEYLDCGIDFVYVDGGDSMTRALIVDNFFNYISEAGIRVGLNLVTPGNTIARNIIHGGGETLAVGIDNNNASDIIGVFGNYIDAADAIQGVAGNVGGNFVGGSGIE